MEKPVDTYTGGDEARLAQITGHKQELKRNHSRLSLLGLAFAILNSWTALASSLSVALPSGGPSTVLWGLIVAGICNVCLAASLAEFLSAYPTAGGQYHWVAMISPRKWAPSLSYICGWINVMGWIFLVGTAASLSSNLILGLVSLTHQTFVLKTWHTYLVYVAIVLIAFTINSMANRLLPLVNRAAFTWSILGFFIIALVTIICARPDYQAGSWVFGATINETGWPSGLAWLLGLLQGAFGLTGYDAVAHMIEEIPRPTKVAPRIMIEAVLIGTSTGFIFLVVLMFSIKDLDAVIEAGTASLVEILYQATSSKAGACVLTVFPIICLVFACTSIMTAASRMVFAFARDNGLPFSSLLAKYNTNLDVPLNALILTSFVVVVYGVLYFASSSALNAILSASVVALGVSYGFPVAVNMLRGRSMLPEDRDFKLTGVLAWTVNSIGMAFVVLTTVLFLFPPVTPTTSSNMNYTVVAFGCVFFIAMVDYVFRGRKHFHGPKIQIEGTTADPPSSLGGGGAVVHEDMNSAKGHAEKGDIGDTA